MERPCNLQVNQQNRLKAELLNFFAHTRGIITIMQIIKCHAAKARIYDSRDINTDKKKIS